MKFQLLAIILFSLINTPHLYGSRFYGVLATNGTSMAGLNGTDMGSLFPMVTQSQHHGSGWGVRYYINGIYGNAVQDGYGPHWNSNEPAYSPDSQNTIGEIFSEIRFGGLNQPNDDDRTDEVNCVIGHIRKASSGCGATGEGDATELPNPHPFVQVFENAKTYSFAHNGTIPEDEKMLLRLWITDAWMYENDFSFQTYGDVAGCGGDWWTEEGWANVIDSEVYFYWILKHIMEDPAMDVTRSIQKALNHPTFRSWDLHKNFVLTDGKAIWAFRSAASNDETGDDLAHTVYWTLNTSNGKNYAAVASQQSGNGWHLLNNNAMVYLPANGKPVVIEGFDYLDGIEMKEIHAGTNWIGFPVLDNNVSTPLVDAMAYLTNIDDNLIDAASISVQNEDHEFSHWLPEDPWYSDPIENVSSTAGYKVTIDDPIYSDFAFPVSGNRVAEEVLISLHAGLNWVTYTPINTQSPSTALPDRVKDHLNSIRGENWFMVYRDGEFTISEYCEVDEDPNRECYKVVYGNMYIIDVSEPVDFKWNISETNDDPYIPRETMVFDPVIKADYLPVVIETVDSSEPVTEIGAFKDGICVGAEVVTGYPVNMKLYSSTTDGVTYQVATEQSGSAKGIGGHEMNRYPINVQTQTVEKGAAFITLTAESNGKNNTLPTELSLVHAYPNPFNPSVNIQFKLDDVSDVQVHIYDLTGTRINTLVSGILQAGLHTFTWIGFHEDGTSVSSGMYIYQIKTNGTVINNKIVMVK